MADAIVKIVNNRPLVKVAGSELLTPLVAAAQAARDAVRPLFGEGPPDAAAGIAGSFYRDVSDPYAPLEWFKTDAGWQGPQALKGDPGGTSDLIGTRQQAQSMTIGPEFAAVRTTGYSAPGDGGGALYKRVASEPVHAGKFQSADGQWWALAGSVVSPEHFGAAGDGVSDDYDALSQMVAYVNAASDVSSVEMRSGARYYIGRYITADNGVRDLEFVGRKGLTINGNGASLELKGDFHRAVSTTRGLCGFRFLGCRDTRVIALEVNGNVDKTTRASGLGEGFTHGLVVSSCDGVTISHCFTHHMASDGLYIASDARAGTAPILSSRNVTVLNTRSRYNARQGLSIIQLRGGTFIDCEFSHAGFSGGSYKEHSPSAGVDIEPNRNTLTPAPNNMDVNTGDIVFDNCRIEDNQGASFLASEFHNIENVRLSRCILITADNGVAGGNDGFILDVPGGIVRDCFIDVRDKYAILGFSSNDVSNIVFEGNTVRGKGGRILTSSASVDVVIRYNNIISYRSTPVTGPSDVPLRITNPLALLEGNNLFIPKEAWANQGSTDRCAGFDFRGKASTNNTSRTDLLPSQGAQGSAHFYGSYTDNVKITNDMFVGMGRGPRDSFRPGINSVFDTTAPYSIGTQSLGTLLLGDGVNGRKMRSDSSVPTKGLSGRGEWIFNRNAAQSQSPGWVCVTAGANSSGAWAAGSTYTTDVWRRNSAGVVYSLVAVGAGSVADEPSHTQVEQVVTGADGYTWRCEATTHARWAPLPALGASAALP